MTFFIKLLHFYFRGAVKINFDCFLATTTTTAATTTTSTATTIALTATTTTITTTSSIASTIASTASTIKTSVTAILTPCLNIHINFHLLSNVILLAEVVICLCMTTITVCSLFCETFFGTFELPVCAWTLSSAWTCRPLYSRNFGFVVFL